MHNPRITVYGIKNCDSIKKTRAWLDGQQLTHSFHDYRVEGITAPLVQAFIDQLGLDSVLNQRSTSWRQLTVEQKCDLTPEKALHLMLANPTLIKRPIIAIGNKYFVGFNPEQIASAL